MEVISTFEHTTLRVGQAITAAQLLMLQEFHGDKTDAFVLVHKGIRTYSFVGVIQLEEFTLEILPKADRHPGIKAEAPKWRSRLIGMLQVVSSLPLQAPTESRLALRPAAVLHLYFELFVREVEQLVRRGLVRQYQRQRSNATALKGRLVLHEQLRQNLVHKERFAVEHDVYSHDHTVHQILAEALNMISSLDTQHRLTTRLAALRFDFPDQSAIHILPTLFERLSPKLTSRRFAPYARAVHIAELLLLRQHPDLSSGKRKVLALLFDMNRLWESFVAAALRRHLGAGFSVSEQSSKRFWQTNTGTIVTLRPDIIVKHTDGRRLAIDTKWKVLKDTIRPSSTDLRQLYAYSHSFNCPSAMLVYPGSFGHVRGAFAKTGLEAGERNGSLLSIPVGEGSISAWMEQVTGAVRGAME